MFVKGSTRGQWRETIMSIAFKFIWFIYADINKQFPSKTLTPCEKFISLD